MHDQSKANLDQTVVEAAEACSLCVPNFRIIHVTKFIQDTGKREFRFTYPSEPNLKGRPDLVLGIKSGSLAVHENARCPAQFGAGKGVQQDEGSVSTRCQYGHKVARRIEDCRETESSHLKAEETSFFGAGLAVQAFVETTKAIEEVVSANRHEFSA